MLLSRRTKIISFLKIVVTLITINSGLVQDLCAQDEKTDVVSIYNSFIDGNDRDFENSICNYIERNPESIDTFFYINNLFDSASLVSPEKVLSVLNKVIDLKSGSQVQNEIIRRAMLCRDRIDYSYRKGAANGFEKKYSPIRHWEMQGPFYRYGAGDYNYKYAPELSPDAWHDKKTLSVNVRNSNGFVIPSYYKYGNRGIVYLSTTFDLKVPSRIRIESDEEFIVFVNQEPIVYNLKGIKKLRERFIHIGSSGKYHIVIKTSLNGSGFRLCKEDDLSLTEKGDGRNIEEQSSVVYQALLDKPDSSDKSLKLARWFEEQDNEEAFKYYQKAYEKTLDPVIDYMWADALIRIGEKQSFPSLADKGWQKIKILSQKKETFVKAKIRYLDYLMTQNEYKKIPKYIEQIDSEAQNSLMYVKLKLFYYAKYDSDHYEEFFDESIKRFPFSNDLYYSAAESLQFVNPERSIALCETLLSRENNVKGVLLLSEILRRTGNLNKINLFDETESDSDEWFFKHAAYLIASEKYSDARTVLMKAAARKDDPRIYELLGRIACLQGKNADLYWEKASTMGPLNYFPSDYLYYKGKDSPFSLAQYIDSEKADSIIDNYLSGKNYDQNILLRRFVHLIYPYDSGLLLCEEIINITNDNDVKRTGEYRIPFLEKFRIIKAETISKNGKYSYSYDIHDVNGESYITLNDLHVNSLIHIIYEVNGYLPKFYDSDMIDFGTMFINNYDESIYSAEVMIVSGKKNVRIKQSSRIVRTDKIQDGVSTTILSIDKVSLKNEARNSENPREILEWYSIASNEELDGFVTWLRGMIRAAGNPEFINKNAKTLETVCAYVLKDIALENRDSFKIKNLSETENLKKGSIFEKVLIAHELLKRIGIQSSLGLVFDYGKDSKSDVMSENFCGFLLYVPSASNGTGEWLDFSEQYMPEGAVSSDYEGKSILVIDDERVSIRKVVSSKPASEKNRIQITIGEDSVNYNSEFVLSGEAITSAKYFVNNINVESEILSRISKYNRDADITNFHVDYKGEKIIITAQGNMNYPIYRNGNRMLLFPFLGNSRISMFAKDTIRERPLLIRNNGIIEDSFIYNINLGFTDDEISFYKKYSFGHIEVSYEIKKRKGLNSITAIRKVYLPETEITSKEYEEFLNFINECQLSDQMKIEIGLKK